MDQSFEDAIRLLETADPVITNLLKRVRGLTDNERAMALSSELKESIKNCKKDDLPYYHLLTAYCDLYIGDKLDDAEKHARIAVDDFRVCQMQWNEAVGHWFLGLICHTKQEYYFYLGELNTALDIVELVRDEKTDQGKYEEARICKKFEDRLREEKRITETQSSVTSKKPRYHWAGSRQAPDDISPESTPFPIKDIKPRIHLGSQDHPTHPESTPLLPKGIKPQVALITKDQGENSSNKGDPPKVSGIHTPEGHEPDIRHIIIPVDVRALHNKDLNSALLDPELFEELQEYEELIENHEEQKERPSGSNKNVLHPKRIVIPSFPIYGRATAGPNGEPYLDPSELEKADAVDETLHIMFEEKKHQVYFINNKPCTFLEGKHYGWLRVMGESMNNTFPHHISNRDYVLYCKNHDMESCVGKIVVAELAELDAQPPQLMVKRLLKLSGQLPWRMDGFATEYSKYMLHSESSLDRDPKTGMSYKKDIEIIGDNQIEGEVVAIAKPV